MQRKADLPSKLCLQCGRPMVWRKKWARCWDEVTVCSDRCRAARRQQARAERKESPVPPSAKST